MGRKGPGIQMVPRNAYRIRILLKHFLSAAASVHPSFPRPSSRCYNQLDLQVSLGKISYLGKGINGEFSLVNYSYY